MGPTELNLVRPSGYSWYFRILHLSRNKVWDRANSTLSETPNYANTAIEAVYDSSKGAYVMKIPAGLPAGRCDLIFYNANYLSAADTDNSEGGYRFHWNGKNIFGEPIAL
jgi:hypothetical protein